MIFAICILRQGQTRFTRYDFLAYDKLTTGLWHDLGLLKLVVGLIYKKQFMSQAYRKFAVCGKVVIGQLYRESISVALPTRK